jgi:hypothetical protein
VTDLRAVQSWFSTVITDPVDVASGAARAGQLPLADVIRSGPRQSAAERLEIYRSGYYSRLVECLADDYPAVKHALGDQAFEELCHAYVLAHPSRSPSLNYFGQHFAPFLAHRGGASARFSSELAQLEWALVEVLHARESDELPLVQLSEYGPDAWARARFRPSAALRVFQFDYPVNAYFQSVRDEQESAIPSLRTTRVAVYRRSNLLWRLELSCDVMYQLLTWLLSGVKLGEALERSKQLGDITEEQIMTWFGHWTSQRFFDAVELG